MREASEAGTESKSPDLYHENLRESWSDLQQVIKEKRARLQHATEILGTESLGLSLSI